MSIEIVNLNPSPADQTNTLLAKMLYRLQLNAGVQADQPSTNVAVTNLPLKCADTFGNQLATQATLAHIDTHVGANLDTTISSRASEATLATRASESTLATRASEATLSTLATEVTAALIASRLIDGGVAKSAGDWLADIWTRIDGLDVTVQTAWNEEKPILEAIQTNTSSTEGQLINLNNQGVVIRNAGMTDTVVVADGHLSTMTTPFLFESAESGIYLGRPAFNYNLLGRRAGFNSTSTLQDVGEWLGTSTNLFPTLTGVEALEIVSSSVADDGSPAGNGAQTVRVTYIDNADAMVTSADIVLNGTTPVALGFTAKAILWMEVTAVGSNEVAAGNIDLRAVTGPVIHERITAGGNKSMSARFRVPANYTAYIPEWTASAIGTTMDVRLRAKVRSDDRALNGAFLFQDTIYIGAGNSQDKLIPWMRFPAGCDIKVSVLPGATAVQNRVDVSISIFLLENA